MAAALVSSLLVAGVLYLFNIVNFGGPAIGRGSFEWTSLFIDGGGMNRTNPSAWRQHYKGGKLFRQDGWRNVVDMTTSNKVNLFH